MFLFRKIRPVIYVLLIVACAVFVRWGRGRSVFEIIIYGPLEQSVKTVRGTFLPYGEVEELRLRLEAEREKNTRLTVENARLEERLRRIHYSSRTVFHQDRRKFEFITAKVVGRTPGSWTSEIIIDRGLRHGVRKNAFVMDARGIVGRIVKVEEGRARVQPITAPGAAASCRILPSGAQGITFGNGGSGLTVDFVATKYKVGVGDRVETSGVGGIYPPGLAIGRISSAGRGRRRLTLPLKARPAADMDRLDFVTVAMKRKTAPPPKPKPVVEQAAPPDKASPEKIERLDGF